MLNRIEYRSVTRYLILLIISAVTAILYWQTNHFQFAVDDIMVISENKFVTQGVKGIPDILNNDSMTGFMGNQPKLLEGGRYRPLSLVLFAIAYEFFKLNPAGYHLMNLLCYILAGIALFFLLNRLFEKIKYPAKPWITGISVLLFMIHPIHTEVVCNIKGNDEILALFFGLFGWMAALKWTENHKAGSLLFTCFFLFLAFMSKESSLPLVVAIPLSLLFFRSFPARSALKLFLILLLPAVVYFSIRYSALGFLFSGEITKTGIMNDPYFEAGFIRKYSTILYTILIYIKLLFFPHPLTHDYYPWQIPLQSAGSPISWAALTVLLFLGYLIVRNRKSQPPWVFVILYFFFTISIVSNFFINVGTLLNERFLFIPSIAFPILTYWFIQKFSGSPLTFVKTIAWGIPGLFIPLYLFLSFERIPDWESNKKLDMADVLVSKNSARANLFAGVSIWNDILKEKNDSLKIKMIEEARIFNNRALAIYPEYADALKMKAGYASEIWKINKDLPSLLKEFDEVMAIKPVPFVEEFVNWLLPRAEKTRLVPFLYRVGYEHLAKEQKNFPEALKYLKMGFQLNNQDAGILFGLCIISGLSGNHREAVEYGDRYIAIYGKNEEIMNYIRRSAMQLNPGNKSKINLTLPK
jgi:tetratricopeptide (TPR) repeat protein